MRVPTRQLLPALGVAMALVLTSCTSGENGSDNASGEPAAAQSTERSRPIVTVVREPSQGFDPAVGVIDADRLQMDLLYARLIELDENYEYTGALAENWEVSDDGLTWTFTLRPSARFSDGSPVTANDVIFSFERLLASETTASVFPEIADMRAEGDQTFVLVLAETATQALLNALTRPGTAGILSEAAVEAAGGPEAYFEAPTATSGPFVLENYTPGVEIELVANDHFWREGYPKTLGLREVFQDDLQAQKASLESGEYDVILLDYADVETYSANPDYAVYTQEQIAPTFYGLNKNEPPFDSLPVRQALAYAIDREGPREACWFNTGLVSYGANLVESDPGYIEIDTYGGDRDDRRQQAEELLDEAGWAMGDDGIRIAQDVEGVPDGERLAFEAVFEANWPAAECNTLIQQQELREVGIELTPRGYDPAAYYTDASEGAFKMWHGGAAAANGLDYYTGWVHSAGVLTPLTTQVNDPEIDAQITGAATAPDVEEASGILQDLERWHAENVPMVTVGHQWTSFGATAQLKDYYLGQYLSSRPYAQAYIAE